MNVWTIMWRWADGSGSGIVPFGFTDKEVAELTVQVLQQEGGKVYELADMTLLDTLGILPKPLAKAGNTEVYVSRRVPHYGVEGKTLFEPEVLTLRLLNALNAEGITRLEHVVCWTEWQLLKIPNLGRKSIDELKSYLHSKGLALKERT
jgi:DNA-directed RNA polymerase subunit alpha